METGYIIGIIVVIVLVGIGIYASRHRVKRNSTDGDIAAGGDMLARAMGIKDLRYTPSGIVYRVEPGANITTPEQQAIEAGLQSAFDWARTKGYVKVLSLNEYIFAIFQSERAPESQIWSFKTPDLGGNYEGSEWDQEGNWVYAAGQTLNKGGRLGNVIALPDHHGTDLDALKEVTKHEAKHVIYWHNDPAMYAITEIHDEGDPEF